MGRDTIWIFYLDSSGNCKLYFNKIFGKRTNSSYVSGKYKIVNDKLIIDSEIEGEKNTWIAEILYLYGNKLRLLDMNGNNIGGVEL